jgi:hypothetical protein
MRQAKVLRGIAGGVTHFYVLNFIEQNCVPHCGRHAQCPELNTKPLERPMEKGKLEMRFEYRTAVGNEILSHFFKYLCNWLNFF